MFAPDPINVPPQEPVYQFWVPTVPFAVRVTVWPTQMLLLEAAILVGAGVEPAQFVDR